ncbi:hypothetical protein [Gluconobacter oxydans]|nr:hypothetical protein [Gluconobacter oxydans]
MICLQRDPVADRSEIVAQMGNAGWLDAGKYALHEFSLQFLKKSGKG